MTEYEFCPHGRHVGAYCEPCRVLEAEKLWIEQNGSQFAVKKEERQSGMNASYYDFPCKNAQELIEWLELDFSNANILKSLIRENNPIVQKSTDELYEAEKKYYYSLRHLNKTLNAYEEAKERYDNAHRHLRSVQEKWAAGGVDSSDAEKGLERKAEE